MSELAKEARNILMARAKPAADPRSSKLGQRKTTPDKLEDMFTRLSKYVYHKAQKAEVSVFWPDISKRETLEVVETAEAKHKSIMSGMPRCLVGIYDKSAKVCWIRADLMAMRK